MSTRNAEDRGGTTLIRGFGEEMNTDSCPEIDALAAAFYAAFDNRGSRVPNAETLYCLLAKEATITRIVGDGVEVSDVASFVEPRIELLLNGGLKEFHEWEIEARTLMTGNIATRCSIYRKEGVLDDAPYGGGGRKLLNLHKSDGRWRILGMLWEDD